MAQVVTEWIVKLNKTCGYSNSCQPLTRREEAIFCMGAGTQDGPSLLVLWLYGPFCARAQGVVDILTSVSPSW